MILRELALILDGKVIGDDHVEISTVSPIESPEKGTILYVEKKKYLKVALNSHATALLTGFDIHIPNTKKPIIQVNDGKLAFIKLLSHFEQKITFPESIHPTAIIGNNVSIGNRVIIMAYSVIMDHTVIKDDVTIYPHCTIGHSCHIEKGTILHSQVVIEKGSIIGQNNIIHSGAVIGSDGFGYYDAESVRYKIPQLGIVETGDNVEIGSNTTIDRATLGKTSIGTGTKIDNLVQVAHNCIIGNDCYIASQVGISGSCHLGNGVILAGQVGIADHVTLGDRVIVLGQSGVTHSIKSDEMVIGFPAKPVSEGRKILASLSSLPNLIRQLKNTKSIKSY